MATSTNADTNAAVAQDEEALKLRSAGKKLFLLTNSHWDYTRAMMSYLLDGDLPESLAARIDPVGLDEVLEAFDRTAALAAERGGNCRAPSASPSQLSSRARVILDCQLCPV